LVKVEKKLSDSLKRINFIFKNEEIPTECVKSYKGFSLLGENFGSFEKGKNYRIEYFKAIPFIEKGILKVVASDKCDNVDVQRYAISERDDQKLIQRNNIYFLNKIKEFKFFMEKEVQYKLKPKIDLDRFNSYAMNIIDSRLLKLLKLSKSELSLDDERKLTTSEKLLYKHLADLIKIWRNFFIVN